MRTSQDLVDLQPAEMMKILKKFAAQSMQKVVGPLMRFVRKLVCLEFMSANVNRRFEYDHVSAKFIPQLLKEDNKKNRLNICYDLREQVGNDPQILSRVVTGDETWCYSYDPETKRALSQWKTPNSPKPNKARQVRSNGKIMLISFVMLMELCTSSLFLLDKLLINNFIWRC